MENAEEIQQIPIKQKNGFAKFIYSVLVTFAVVFVVGIFFSRIVFFPIKVEGISMQPTLNAQASSACDTVYLSNPRNVSRGDIIVFNAANYTVTNNNENYFIKRAIGLPGDTIYFQKNGTVKNGKIYYDIYVNGVKIEEGYTKEPMWFNTLQHSQAEQNFFLEYIETKSPIHLDKNEYFLMGDNRNNSTDSRYLGAIKKSDFLGKVVLQVKSNQTIIEAIIQKIF